MISFVFSSRIINEFHKCIFRTPVNQDFDSAMRSQYEAAFPPGTDDNLDEEKTDGSEEGPDITAPLEPHDLIGVDVQQA